MKKEGFPNPLLREDFDSTTKIVIELDHQGYSTGLVWFSSSLRDCLITLIKLHDSV
jgi:hypothetical protein